MKFALILIPTLAAGFALGTVLRSRPLVAPAASPTVTITNLLTNTVRTTVDLPVTNPPGSRSDPFYWGQLGSTNLHGYVANLRAVGCPEQTVKDILLAIVNKQFAPQFAAVKPPPQSYWQRRRPYSLDVAQAKQLRALETERRAMLKELLGYEVKDADHRGYKPDERDEFKFLSPERHAALGDTLTHLREQQEQQMQMVRAELVSTNHSLQFREQQVVAKWRELEGQTRAQITNLLTKDELEEYDLRTSGTARHLRHTLGGFDATPEEFREVFRLQRQLDEQFKVEDATGRKVEESQRQEWNTAKERMEAQLKQTLGEQRFADYQRSLDFDYQSLITATDKYDLSVEVPNQAWSLRQSAQAQRQRILDQPGLSAAQQKAQLEHLMAVTREQMTQIMGESGLQRYEKLRGPKWWMNDLATSLSGAPKP